MAATVGRVTDENVLQLSLNELFPGVDRRLTNFAVANGSRPTAPLPVHAHPQSNTRSFRPRSIRRQDIADPTRMQLLPRLRWYAQP